MNNLKIVLVVVISILVLLAVASFSQPKEEVLIGYFGPLTGPVANTTGESVFEAIKMANAKMSDVPIRIIFEDDGCVPAKAVTAAQKLINVDKVDILISGVCSGSTMAVAPLAEEKGIVLISPVAATPALTTAGDYVFRLSASSVAAGEAASDLMVKKGFNRAVVLYENAEYTVGWKDALVGAFKNKGGLILAEESFPPNGIDVRSQLTKLKRSGVEILIVAANSPATAINVIKQAEELGVEFPIVGNEYFSFPDVYKNSHSIEVFATEYKYDLKSPQMSAFLDTYKETYQRNVKQTIYGALAYDVYSVLHDGIKECRVFSSDCLRDYLYGVKNYSGASGLFSVDKNGDTERAFVLRRVVKGQIVE